MAQQNRLHLSIGSWQKKASRRIFFNYIWGCRSYEDLLSAAPSDISQADKQAQKQAQQEAAQQLEAARQKVHGSPPAIPTTAFQQRASMSRHSVRIARWLPLAETGELAGENAGVPNC